MRTAALHGAAAHRRDESFEASGALDPVADAPVLQVLGILVLVVRRVLAEPGRGIARERALVQLEHVIRRRRVHFLAVELDLEPVRDRAVEDHPVQVDLVPRRVVGDLEGAVLRDARLLRRAVAAYRRPEEELAALLVERLLVVENLDPAQRDTDARALRHDWLLWRPGAWTPIEPPLIGAKLSRKT